MGGCGTTSSLGGKDLPLSSPACTWRSAARGRRCAANELSLQMFGEHPVTFCNMKSATTMPRTDAARRFGRSLALNPEYGLPKAWMAYASTRNKTARPADPCKPSSLCPGTARVGRRSDWRRRTMNSDRGITVTPKRSRWSFCICPSIDRTPTAQARGQEPQRPLCSHHRHARTSTRQRSSRRATRHTDRRRAPRLYSSRPVGVADKAWQPGVGGDHLGNDPGARLVGPRGVAHAAITWGEGGVEADLKLAAAHDLAQAAPDMELGRRDDGTLRRGPPQDRRIGVVPGKDAALVGRGAAARPTDRRRPPAARPAAPTRRREQQLSA